MILSVSNAEIEMLNSIVNAIWTSAMGTVTITSPVTGLEFKIDNGSFGAYPTGGWSGLTPGDHTITVRSAADPACTTPKTVTIGQVPNAPTAPTNELREEKESTTRGTAPN